MKHLKMLVNSMYGKLCSEHDNFTQMQVTINSKLDINTLIEKLKINDIHGININTDCISIKCTSDKFNVCKTIIDNWAGINKTSVNYEEYKINDKSR